MTKTSISMETIPESNFAALLNPRLALLVTCCDSQGQPNVLAVAWHTPLSHVPPMLGISIGGTRYSHNLIQDTGDFAVNIMGVSMLNAVKICGELTGELDDKFSIAEMETKLARKISVPVLCDALGVLECRLENQVKTGDHTFFIGRVLYAEAHSGCFSRGWVDSREDGVLLHLRKNHYTTFIEEF